MLGISVERGAGVSGIGVETGVDVNAGASVEVGAGLGVEEELTGASEPQADEIKISPSRIQVTFDCFLMGAISFRVDSAAWITFVPTSSLCFYN